MELSQWLKSFNRDANRVFLILFGTFAVLIAIQYYISGTTIRDIVFGTILPVSTLALGMLVSSFGVNLSVRRTLKGKSK